MLTHDFDVDKPVKTAVTACVKRAQTKCWLHRVIVTWWWQKHQKSKPIFDYLLTRFDTNTLDLDFAEGCKNIAFLKLNCTWDQVGKPWLYPNDSNIIAIAADSRGWIRFATNGDQRFRSDSRLHHRLCNNVRSSSKTSVSFLCASSKDNTPVVCCDSSLLQVLPRLKVSKRLLIVLMH